MTIKAICGTNFDDIDNNNKIMRCQKNEKNKIFKKKKKKEKMKYNIIEETTVK